MRCIDNGTGCHAAEVSFGHKRQADTNVGLLDRI